MTIMNTNDPQFQKAYNDLITAFFSFMKVVNPKGDSRSILPYIASQLNQLLNCLEVMPRESQSQVEESTPITVTQDPASVKEPGSEQTTTNLQPMGKMSLNNPVIKYCAYPELTNGQYKFKSSALKVDSGDESNEQRENYIYKLTIDEEANRGYVELAELSPDQVMIIANNPTLYTPQDICVGANNITPGKTSITSKSILRLEKAIRGWVIAAGEKFSLTVI